MIQLPALSLDAQPARYLREWQLEIDQLKSYSARVAMAKSSFSARNTSKNATFAHVKSVLTRMCQGARRCGYCEDSFADEVEHIKPKDLYPEAAFSWDNYLYACGPCNGPKNNQWAVLRGKPLQIVDVTRAHKAKITKPLAGSPALLNPRIEDPLNFLFLDLLNTFAFDVRLGLTPVEESRARYTIEVLRLNERDNLLQARRTAFGTYRARLKEYVAEKKQGASAADLRRRQNELLKVDHQTVWREMQRQQSSYPPLATLFADAPEALAW